MSKVKTIFTLTMVIIFVLSTYFMIICYSSLNINVLSIFEDSIIILCIPTLIIVVFKSIFNFKDNINMDNLRQAAFRYIYIIVVYFYTKCGLKMFDLEKLSINNVVYICIWMCFLTIGTFFFLIDRKGYNKIQISNDERFNGKLKKFVKNNKDATNLYSFVIKELPLILYNIFLLYYSTKIVSNLHLVTSKIDSSIKPSNFQLICLVIALNVVPYVFIKFVKIALPISMMIYSSILMISSFLSDKSTTFERKLYRLFVLILGIVLLCGISYSYLYIVDSDSFKDLIINFQLTPFGIIKLISHFFYFSLVTFTTTGYGDITPTSQMAQCMVLIQMIIEIVTITISIGIFFYWENENKIKSEKYESIFTKVIIFIWEKITILKFKSKYTERIVALLSIIVFEVFSFAIIYNLTSKWFFVKSGSNNLFTFLYFSVTTLSTIGFGDIYPSSLITKFLVSLQMLTQMSLVLFGINIINSNFKKNNTVNKSMIVKNLKQDFAIVELENRKVINIPKQLLPEGIGKGELIEIQIEIKK
ncbi:ion channel [Clostridium sp. DJ247]|uniref:ion channel n=1 Tax=Clostridium sp. DJ247 TaxID=2726188 RepID=UPI00162497BC|nr:ion channel [Clostridium sp. DJ247]MBC2579379.1 hypothetical protein [Clostridium sp. DJ247]